MNNPRALTLQSKQWYLLYEVLSAVSLNDVEKIVEERGEKFEDFYSILRAIRTSTTKGEEIKSGCGACDKGIVSKQEIDVQLKLREKSTISFILFYDTVRMMHPLKYMGSSLVV